MPTPPWLGATPGSPGLAAHVNQFLGSHAVTYIYTGVQQSAGNTLGSGSVNSNGLWMAQKFTAGAGQTAVGRVVLDLGMTGSPPPLTVSLYAYVGGAPGGSPLASTQVPKEFGIPAGGQIFVPLPATVTPSAGYYIVTQADGDANNYWSWFKNNVGSGAETSPDGVTWTSQAYGLWFEEFDQAVTSGGLLHTWEDSGARWTELAYNAHGQVSNYAEFTAGQTPGGYTASSRALTYSGGTLIGVA